MDTIISKSNEKVKYLKSLNDKKFRQKYNAFYLEGIKVVEEILDKKAIDILFIAYSNELLLNSNGGKKLLKKIESFKEDKLIHLEKNLFSYIVDTKAPQGVLVVLKLPNNNIDDIILSNTGDVIILDKVQDLGNIGTIIRSAVAFNITNIIAIYGTCDVFSPKVVRSTMGAINKINITYIKKEQINNFFDKLKNYGYNIIGTSLKSSKFINETFFTSKCAFVFGNEAKGISKEVLDLCDNNIKIPMKENVESLNVSVAASIVLYKNYIDKNTKK